MINLVSIIHVNFLEIKQEKNSKILEYFVCYETQTLLNLEKSELKCIEREHPKHIFTYKIVASETKRNLSGIDS